MIPKRIALLTDSCADLPADLAAEYRIRVVPLRILCADGEYLDGETIRGPEVCARLRAGELPQTSLPAADDYIRALRGIVAAGYDGVVAVTLSGGLSGTYNLVRLIAEECGSRLPVAVFDSRSGSLGQGLTVLQLAEDLRAGMGWEELTQRRAPQLLAGTRPFFSVDTLEYLQKGGRIGRITATAGTLLQIKPILSFAPDGQLTSLAKVRGRKAAIQKMVQMAAARVPRGARFNLAVAHGDSPAELKEIRVLAQKVMPDFEAFAEGEIDCTLGSYVGPQLLGVGVQLLESAENAKKCVN